MKKNGIVCAFGTFDILHPGHIRYLHAAAVHGTTLIVVVTPDSAVKRRKGHVPRFTEKERMTMVAALRGVDKVVLGDRSDSWHVLAALTPAIICLGYDQRDARTSLMHSRPYERIGRPPIIMIPGFRPTHYHSSRYTHYA